jgi:hypothetical protein
MMLTFEVRQNIRVEKNIRSIVEFVYNNDIKPDDNPRDYPNCPNFLDKELAPPPPIRNICLKASKNKTIDEHTPDPKIKTDVEIFLS